MNKSVPIGYRWVTIGHSLVCYDIHRPLGVGVYRASVYTSAFSDWYRWNVSEGKNDGCLHEGVADNLRDAQERALIALNDELGRRA